jgi:DNA repair exonuclease SbcCD ATPase subunit
VTNIALGQDYEDESAQSVINEKFGTAFDITSYVQQNAINSFIFMNPSEKLEFLEKFSFHGIDLAKIKGKCQAEIKKRNEELIAVSSRLEMANEQLSSMVKPEKVPFPIKCTDREKAMKNEETRLKNTKILIKRCEREILALKKELEETRLFSAKMETRLSTLSTLENKMEKLKIELLAIDYIGDEELSTHEKDLANILGKRQLINLREKYEQDKKRFEDMQETEEVENAEMAEKIRENLWKEYTNSEIAGLITDQQQVLADVEKRDRLKSELAVYSSVDAEKLEKNKGLLERSKQELANKRALEVKVKMQQDVHTCPACNTQLRLQDDELCLYNEDDVPEIELEDIKKDILLLSRQVTKLEASVREDQTKMDRKTELEAQITDIEDQYEELPEKSETQDSIDYLKEYKRSQLELEKKLKILESDKGEKLSSSLATFKSQLDRQLKTIQNLEKSCEKIKCIYKEEELRDLISTQKQNKEKLASLEKQEKIMTSELVSLQREIRDLKEGFSDNYSCVRDISELEKEVGDKEGELETLRKTLEKHEVNMVKIEEYKKYKEELNRYKEWKGKVISLTEEEAVCRKRYSASTMLKEKILEAESISILNVINSINLHAQQYLELFFPDHPIVVRLSTFKQTKKNTKPQINLEIDYKGMEADISMLSGGETSRVNLAFTLALSELFNAPLIMLDECTASLDQDLTNDVLEGIKKNFEGKMVLVIAHQVVEASFDTVISM